MRFLFPIFVDKQIVIRISDWVIWKHFNQGNNFPQMKQKSFDLKNSPSMPPIERLSFHQRGNIPHIERSSFDTKKNNPTTTNLGLKSFYAKNNFNTSKYMMAIKEIHNRQKSDFPPCMWWVECGKHVFWTLQTIN